MFDGIQAVPQGSWMSFDLNSLKVIGPKKYWSLADQINPENYTSSPEEIDHALAVAVKDRLVAEVEVGICLSGGFDSSLIAAHASDNQSGLRAFTLFAPDDQKNNEIGLASEIADNFGLIHEGLPVDVSDGISSALDMMYYSQEPFLAFPQTIYFFEKLVTSAQKSC